MSITIMEVSTMDIYERLDELEIELFIQKPSIGIFVPMKEFCGKNVYTSGHGCAYDGTIKYIGKVGSDVNLENATWSARQCMINILSSFHNQFGDLNKISKVIKILGFVASSSDFYDQSKVLNGASQLLIDIFGEENGKAARSAIGVAVLPKNQPVEIEAIFELK